MKTSEPPETLHDGVLAEVRRHKLEIAEKHGFSMRSLAKDLQRRQQGHPRLVAQPAKRRIHRS